MWSTAHWVFPLPTSTNTHPHIHNRSITSPYRSITSPYPSFPCVTLQLHISASHKYIYHRVENSSPCAETVKTLQITTWQNTQYRVDKLKRDFFSAWNVHYLYFYTYRKTTENLKEFFPFASVNFHRFWWSVLRCVPWSDTHQSCLSSAALTTWCLPRDDRGGWKKTGRKRHKRQTILKWKERERNPRVWNGTVWQQMWNSVWQKRSGKLDWHKCGCGFIVGRDSQRQMKKAVWKNTWARAYVWQKSASKVCHR